jgi:hypothetical protein
MKLLMFAVVHAHDGAFDDPLVHCHAGDQLVLAYISRQALMDYFRVPGDKPITTRQWNLVVDRNLDALKPIIEDKFERDDWQPRNAFRQSYPELLITLDDMRRSPEKFTMDVLDLDASFWRKT